MDDFGDFQETQKAFDTLGIPEADRWGIFRILAGVLYMGNVKFDGLDGNEAAELAVRLRENE